MAEKRVLKNEETKGFSIQDLIIVAVLLAAGAVLRFCVGSFLTILGMQPNFIIASYCLAILLVRPNLAGCAIIGVLAGFICLIKPAAPYINLVSELLGGVTMFFMMRVPVKFKKLDLNPLVSTFVSTVVSGGSFVICLFVFLGATKNGLAFYIPIVLGTAAIGSVIVHLMYLPLKKVLNR